MILKYCSECGAKLSPSEKFCSNCGTKIDLPCGHLNEHPESGDKLNEEEGQYDSAGYIFTNLPALAKTLTCNPSKLRSEIEKYIEALEQINHKYTLIDCADNAVEDLAPSDSWELHIEVLEELLDDNVINPFLFILGGNEVIPMPCIRNEPALFESDENIYSDLPFSYMMNHTFADELWAGNLMAHELRFQVGRFPTGGGVCFDDLANYLANTISALTDSRLVLDNCFGISASSWEITSEAVIADIEPLTELTTSPEVDENNIDEIFSAESSAYFFNLHGSDTPGSACYFGDDGMSNPRAIFPHNLASARNFNILMTEACYGGRFIDYDKDDSMLLTAITNKTIEFLGSNVVAFGNPGSSDELLGADVLVNQFIKEVISGRTAGEALSLARVSTYELADDDDLNYALTTILEFSLYGDPVFALRNVGQKKSVQSRALIGRPLKNKGRAKERSILTEVRALVDLELERIKSKVNDYMYSKFMMNPHCLHKVFAIGNDNHRTGYNFIYLDRSKQFSNYYSVYTNSKGIISKIYATK